MTTAREHSRRWMLQRVMVLGMALSAVLAGCAAQSTTRATEAALAARGHLVIVGGGLEDENRAVYSRFVSLCGDGPIGIIPTASGDGLDAGSANVERFAKYADGRALIVVPLTKDDADRANDPEIARLIESCGGLWFTGGDQSRVTAVFAPEGRESASLRAAWRVLERGGVIGGSSAGAAIMSDPMITGGRARRGDTGRDPENAESERGVRLGRGLGFLPEGITDQHFLERGRLPRLVEALDATGQRFGYGVSENCALIVDLSAATGEVIGDAGVLVIERRPTEVEQPARTRAWLFSTGDRFPMNDPMRALPADADQPVRVRDPGGTREFTLSDACARDAIERAARALGDGDARVRVVDRAGSVVLSVHPETSVRPRQARASARTPFIGNVDLMFEPAATVRPVARP